MLTSATRGETLTPNPNECHFMLTSAIRGIYPYPTLLRRGSQFPQWSRLISRGPRRGTSAKESTPTPYIYIYIYIASELSMILSILRLNHGLFT